MAKIGFGFVIALAWIFAVVSLPGDGNVPLPPAPTTTQLQVLG